VHPFDGQLQRVSTMLVVADLTVSAGFYQQFFGLAAIESNDHIVLLNRDSFFLYIVTRSPPTPDKPSVTLDVLNAPTATSVNIVFRVSDCRSTFEQLQLLGLSFLAPPHNPTWGGWRCFARDPDGYLIEIEEL